MNEDATLRTLNEILQKLQDIDNRLRIVEKSIKGVQYSTSNMDRHISFVERVYDTIQTPMYFILNKMTSSNPIYHKPIEWISLEEDW
jgi:hypothetical protein